MINIRLTRQGGTWLALAMTGLLLQACNPAKAPEAVQGPRVYAVDVTGGAKVCEVPKVSPAAGKSTDAVMTVGNDGGWCGITLTQGGDKPYDAGLLHEMPRHGTVLIHEVGDTTRVDYTPDPHFTGSDTFVVGLIPGDATIRTSVTVVAPTSTQGAQTKR